MLRRFLSTDLLAGMIMVACGIALFSVWLAAQQPGGQGNADIVLHNGKVLTVDDKFSIAEGVALSGNKISAVGTNQQVLQQAGPNTLRIDLKGRTVVPGLMDTHINSWVGPAGYRAPLPPDNMWDFNIDWRGVTRKEDVLNQMRGFMDKYKPAAGKWLRFQNNPQGEAQAILLFDGLDRYELDTVTPNNPVILALGYPNENGLLINSKAIEIVWKSDGDFIKKYGGYWVGKDGQPHGHLEGPLSHRVLAKYMPRATADEMAPAYRKMMEEFNGQGLTTIANKMRLHAVEAFKNLERRSEQTVRLAYGMGMDYFGVITDPEKDLAQFQGQMGSGTEMNWAISMMPNSLDGSGTRRCTNLKRAQAFSNLDRWWPVGQCYTDNEYHGGGGRGAARSANYYREWIMALGKYKLRLGEVHISGDRSHANVLDMMEEIVNKYGADAVKNWAFDHCSIINPKEIPRAARLGLMFTCNPAEDADNFALVHGEEYAHTWLAPVKSLVDAGIRVGYSSATYAYPWQGMQQFVTRKDEKGKVWGPQERVDRPTALRMATRWNADYVLRGDKLGSIEPGKLADLVIIDKDYLTIPTEQIHEIQTLLTMFDGRIAFVHTDFAKEYNLRPAGAVISTLKELQARRPPDPRSGNDGLR